MHNHLNNRTLSLVSLQATPQGLSGDIAKKGGELWCYVPDTLRLQRMTHALTPHSQTNNKQKGDW